MGSKERERERCLVYIKVLEIIYMDSLHPWNERKREKDVWPT